MMDRLAYIHAFPGILFFGNQLVINRIENTPGGLGSLIEKKAFIFSTNNSIYATTKSSVSKSSSLAYLCLRRCLPGAVRPQKTQKKIISFCCCAAQLRKVKKNLVTPRQLYCYCAV